jgi:hypothetical protein
MAVAVSWRRTAAPASIVVRRGGHVPSDVPGVHHAEPWLAVDPPKPAHAIAVALAESGVDASVDGGMTFLPSVCIGGDSTKQLQSAPIQVMDDVRRR